VLVQYSCFFFETIFVERLEDVGVEAKWRDFDSESRFAFGRMKKIFASRARRGQTGREAGYFGDPEAASERGRDSRRAREAEDSSSSCRKRKRDSESKSRSFALTPTSSSRSTKIVSKKKHEYCTNTGFPRS